MSLSLIVGDTGYLIAKTLTAGPVCWKQPRVTLISYAHPMVTVRLDDGTEHTTHENNLVRNLPSPPKDRKPKAPARPALKPSPDWEEVPLW